VIDDDSIDRGMRHRLVSDRQMTLFSDLPRVRATAPDGKEILMHRIGIGAVAVSAVALVLGGLSVSVPAQGAAAPTCMGQRATIVGTGGVDTINGTAGADVIVGFAGADIIRGHGGNDKICGGAGADRIRGGAGRDRIRGGIGADRIRGGAGSDRLWGGIGADVIYGGPGADRIRGGPGSDTCFSPKHAPGCEF
jgi:Ca2+-binding RTX toxin-like protein